MIPLPPSPSILPTHQLDSTVGHGALTSAPAATPGQPKRLPRMLLVDDNRINLRVLQVCMKKRGYPAISSAEDGLQAVNTYQELFSSTPSRAPDIVLMDISMPVMNGFEATRRIRKIESEHNSQLTSLPTPRSSLIIALTGLASVKDQREAFASGVDLYIMKPISIAKLSQLLEDWEANGKIIASRDVPHEALSAENRDDP